jgi:hypothetical protein
MKRQLYQPGKKILLTNGINNDEVLEKVKCSLFLYEIVEWSKNGKMAKIEYKNKSIGQAETVSGRTKTVRNSSYVSVLSIVSLRF